MTGVLTRVAALSAPSRILVVIDLSGSMRAAAGNGMDRITFAGRAAVAAGNLMPDIAQAGLWGFSRHLRGEANRVEFLDVEALGARDGPRTHRERLNRAMLTLSTRVGGNGTALYETAAAAMQKMTSLYDPRAGNAVVLFTDGADSDPGGPGLADTVRRLRALYDPERPVRLIAIGIGPDANLPALRGLAQAAGGNAFQATRTAQLPEILFTTLAQRKGG